MRSGRIQSIGLAIGCLLLATSACAPSAHQESGAGTEAALIATLTQVARSANEQAEIRTPAVILSNGANELQELSTEILNAYPDGITFTMRAISVAPIQRIAIFHRLQGQNSFTLVPVQFTPGDEVVATFTWDTSRITVAPSAPIYYYWELEDENGGLYQTDEALVYYDDTRFAWQELSDDELIVRWYEGDEAFGDLVYEVSRQALDQMKGETGMGLEYPIFVLLYADQEDFASWHFYVEDWVGGQAFTPLGVTTEIMGAHASPFWIMDVIPHEIAHLFFYQLTSSNLASWPSWLDEGFAQYYEFSDKDPALERVVRAARSGDLTPLRYLSGSFGHDPGGVRLAYDESLSAVVFLLETWGGDGLRALIEEIRTGATTSAALGGALGVTFEEFEARWLMWLGVPATPRPSPTLIPTFGVFGGPTQQSTATPTP